MALCTAAILVISLIINIKSLGSFAFLLALFKIGWSHIFLIALVGLIDFVSLNTWLDLCYCR